MKSKLERIIKAAKEFDFFGMKKLKGFSWNLHSNSCICIKTQAAWKNEEGVFCEQYFTFSLNDLIFSPDSNLMKCFFGEEDEWFTTECTCVGVDFHLYGPDIHKKECAKCGANRGKTYYQIQLLPLNDQERIEYLANALGVE